MKRKLWILIVTAPLTLSAQVSVFGGGGMGFGFLNTDFSTLNESLSNIGFPQMEKENIFVMGGIGYAEVITEKLRLLVGGGGAGGSIRGERDTLETEVKVSYGYFLAGIPFRIFKRLYFALNLGIGGGGSEIKLKILSGNSQFGGPDEDGVRVAMFEKSFFLLRPGVIFECQVVPFIRIAGDFSYFLPIGGSWKEEEFKTRNAPDFSPSGFYAGITILLGGGTGY
jgi:hypothetical protein